MVHLKSVPWSIDLERLYLLCSKLLFIYVIIIICQIKALFLSRVVDIYVYMCVCVYICVYIYISIFIDFNNFLHEWTPLVCLVSDIKESIVVPGAKGPISFLFLIYYKNVFEDVFLRSGYYSLFLGIVRAYLSMLLLDTTQSTWRDGGDSSVD